MSFDDRYIIDTPENIEFSYDVAGIGSRFLAAIIDTAIILLLQAVLSAVIGAIFVQVNDLSGGVGSIVLAIWGLLSFLFLWGYYLFFEMVWNGQSPGKRSIRLRVVRTGGRPVTFVASAVRNLVRVIDFLPLFYGLGVLMMFIDQRARRLGDLAGGTLVVKEQHTISLEALTSRAEAAPPPIPREVEALPLLPNLSALKEDDYNLIQEFLRRRRELGRESRQRLGLQLAQVLGQRLGITFDAGYHEALLERLTIDYRRAYQEANRPQHLAEEPEATGAYSTPIPADPRTPTDEEASENSGTA
ncbi:MAG: RDD family protein [Chloroflexaceae bacterium]|nr:RDD family protein [Chloroflexaceae bacterium]NJO05020.1 RDD family protein [Chloroflexaceae bacterium]